MPTALASRGCRHVVLAPVSSKKSTCASSVEIPGKNSETLTFGTGRVL